MAGPRVHAWVCAACAWWTPTACPHDGRSPGSAADALQAPGLQPGHQQPLRPPRRSSVRLFSRRATFNPTSLRPFNLDKLGTMDLVSRSSTAFLLAIALLASSELAAQEAYSGPNDAPTIAVTGLIP